jgi:hypothetical protein
MVDPGQLVLYDSVRPALTAGDYRFDLATSTAAGPFSAVRWLTVDAPRFRIEEQEITSRYPMPGAEGDFNDQLPWVALRRRTLPWERRGSVADPASPWLALAITLPDEAEISTGSLSTVVGAAAAAGFGKAPPDPVTSLKFPDVATLRAVLPTEPDTRLLCHVRAVNQADTEVAGSDDDGWVAVVVANRLLTTSERTRWRATLVSLEHRDDLAAGQPDTAAVLALASWEFTSTGVGSFRTLITKLDRAAFGTATRVSLPYTDVGGVTANALYHPPAAPEPSTPDAADITERAAHELGRLIAAADGRLLRELVGWRRHAATTAARAVTARFLAGAAPAVHAAVRQPGPAHLTAASHALGHLAGAQLPAARPAHHPGTGTGTPAPTVPAEGPR